MNFSVAFFGLITWFPLCVWIVCLVHWAIGGDIDIFAAIAGVTIALVLGVVAIRPPVEILSPIACTAAYLTVFAYPIVAAAANRYAMKQLDVEEVEDAYRVIGQTPDNPLAKFKLAKAIYKNGYIGHAVAIADESMARIPRRIAEEEFRMLQKWKRMGVPPETLKPMTCIECQTYCQPGWTHCRNCGAQFLLQRVKGQMLPGGLAQKIVSVWGGAVLLLIGLPIISDLPTALAVVTTLLLFGLVGLLLFFTFRRKSELHA